MKFLITGGAGFLGSNLALEVLNTGQELSVFDNLYRSGAEQNLEWLKKNGKFEFIYGDISNRNDIETAIKNTKPDFIFHLAGQVAMTTSISNPRLDFEVNAIGTLNLLESIRQYAPKAGVIYASTNKVYGDLEQYSYVELDTRYKCIDMPNGFNEEIALSFHSPYGCSKGAADQYMLDYARIYGLKTAVFRHSSMYGGRQFATYDQGWIGWFCQKAIEVKNNVNAGKITISGNGKQVRDVLHIKDVVTLYFAAAPKINDIAGQAFNIGGGIQNSASLLELFNILENLLNIKMQFSKLPERVSDQRVFIADLSKIYGSIGWRPIVPINEGIDNMVKWLKELVPEGK